jgi:cytoskeletal protein RodZ
MTTEEGMAILVFVWSAISGVVGWANRQWWAWQETARNLQRTESEEEQSVQALTDEPPSSAAAPASRQDPSAARERRREA